MSQDLKINVMPGTQELERKDLLYKVGHAFHWFCYKFVLGLYFLFLVFYFGRTFDLLLIYSWHFNLILSDFVVLLLR